ncbi:MAG: hypothetical protein ACFB2W_26505 [Leptolyngbyaceae cyanobacterium]
MSQIKDTFLRRLLHNYSRYILLTVIGSSTLLVSFDWSAETSLLSAASLGVLLELLISGMKSKPLPLEEDGYSPQMVTQQSGQPHD